MSKANILLSVYRIYIKYSVIGKGELKISRLALRIWSFGQVKA